jgi:hypothetical protein
MSALSDYLKSETGHIRAESERRKAEKQDWQRAVLELVNQMLAWVTASEPKDVLQYRRTEHTFDDYDIGGNYQLTGRSLILGDATVRIVPSNLPVVGAIQVPGEDHRRKVAGRVEFDNGIDRVSLYRVKDGERDIRLWWTHGGVGKPFDRESFEAILVSLLR